jgi:hypothetical protein
MGDNVLNAVKCFHVEEVDRIMRGRKMAVHAVCDKTLEIVDMR